MRKCSIKHDVLDSFRSQRRAEREIRYPPAANLHFRINSEDTPHTLPYRSIQDRKGARFRGDAANPRCGQAKTGGRVRLDAVRGNWGADFMGGTEDTVYWGEEPEQATGRQVSTALALPRLRPNSAALQADWGLWYHARVVPHPLGCGKRIFT